MKKNLGYICSACAEKKGFVWPEGHCATAHTGKCGYCKKVKQLTALSDWNKPGDKGKTLAKWD